MTLYSNNRTIERAQPWLGTLVSIRIADIPEKEGNLLLDAAFCEVSAVHRLMSFHDPSSDLSHLNGTLPGKAGAVDPLTYEVLQQALEISNTTDGCFDITVAAQLMEWELLPSPHKKGNALAGSWRDIELLPDNRVVLHRPVQIDLGGIAKGFAVDRAIDCLKSLGAQHAVVNAGGDIRVTGDSEEQIYLRVNAPNRDVPILEIREASVASSSGDLQRRWHQGVIVGPHIDGASRLPATTDRFVAVVHERCIIADALTKVVMVHGSNSKNILKHYGAGAYVHDPMTDWYSIEAERAVIG